jgi:hypothetical protein
MSKPGACPGVLPGDDDLDAIRRKLYIHGGDELVDSLSSYAGRAQNTYAQGDGRTII